MSRFFGGWKIYKGRLDIEIDLIFFSFCVHIILWVMPSDDVTDNWIESMSVGYVFYAEVFTVCVCVCCCVAAGSSSL